MSTEILTENEKKGELKRVRMPGYGIFLSVLAWPAFTIGVIMLVLDFLVYSGALAVSYRFRESWSGILSIPGVVFVLYSFGCFVCERREKDAN